MRTVVNLIDEALTLDSARKEAEADVKKLLKLHGDLLEVLRELQAAYDAQGRSRDATGVFAAFE